MVADANLAAPHGGKAPFLTFSIEGQSHQSLHQYITGLELKQLAGIPLDTELYLSITRPWADEVIDNQARVDLARPGIEYFYVRKKLHLTVNGVSFTWYKQYITESEIKELGQIDEANDIYLVIKPPFTDELIGEGASVDLARPGKEHFIAKPKPGYTLIINAQPKSWAKATISFEDLVALAYGTDATDANKSYTVVYAQGPPQKPKGILVKGEAVQVKNEMKFDVTGTDKS